MIVRGDYKLVTRRPVLRWRTSRGSHCDSATQPWNRETDAKSCIMVLMKISSLTIHQHRSIPLRPAHYKVLYPVSEGWCFDCQFRTSGTEYISNHLWSDWCKWQRSTYARIRRNCQPSNIPNGRDGTSVSPVLLVEGTLTAEKNLPSLMLHLPNMPARRCQLTLPCLGGSHFPIFL